MPPKKTDKKPEKKAKPLSVDKQLTALEEEREEVSYETHGKRHGVLFKVGKNFMKTGSCTNVILSCFCLCIVLGIIIGIIYLAGGFDGVAPVVPSPSLPPPSIPPTPPPAPTAVTVAANTTVANTTTTATTIATVL